MLKSVSQVNAKRRRSRGAPIQVLGLLCVGAILGVLLHRPVLGSAVGATALLLLIGERLYPSLANALENFTQKLTSLAAAAIGWILLAPFYLIFFSAGHAVLGLGSRDPLRLKFPSDESSDWLPVSSVRASEDYSRPY